MLAYLRIFKIDFLKIGFCSKPSIPAALASMCSYEHFSLLYAVTRHMKGLSLIQVVLRNSMIADTVSSPFSPGIE